MKDLGEKITGQTINVPDDETIVGIIDKITKKYTAPTIPTKTSDLNNDSHYIASEVITAFWKGTQDEYDLIEEKSATTMYIIVEEA